MSSRRERGYDLAASTAYSDSHTDLPFLEAVGNPMVVNPDRELRRLALDRGWPVLASTSWRSRRGAAAARPRCSGSRSCSAQAPRSGRPGGVRPEERIAALGFSEADTATLPATSSTPSRVGSSGTGSRGSTGSRRCPISEPDARPRRLHADPGYERWDGNGALGYLTLAAIVDAQLAAPPAHARVVVASNCFPTGMLGWYVRRLAEAGLVAALTATSPARLAHPDGGEPLAGTNPLAIAIPSSDGAPIVADVSMGAVTYGDVLRGAARPDELVPSAASRRTRASRSPSGSSSSSARSPATASAPCSSSRGRRRIPCRRCARRAAGLRLPGDA